MNSQRFPKLFGITCLLVGSILGSSSHSAMAASVTSTFDSNNDGWVVLDAGGGNSTQATWESDGYISTTDTYSWVSFGAPDKFLGNLLGKNLSFDLYSQANDSTAGTFFTVLIASGLTTLHWYGGTPSTTGFSNFSVNLVPSQTSQWKIGGNGYSSSGSAVTQEQFTSVLQNVTRLQIDADWNVGPDYVRLDNVSVTPVPEPETYAMFLAGLGLMGAIARRRRAA